MAIDNGNDAAFQSLGVIMEYNFTVFAKLPGDTFHHGNDEIEILFDIFHINLKFS